MSKTEEALLPCPFCGGEAETIWNYTENCLETKCSNCSTYFREGNDREEAIKAWNTRHQEGQEMIGVWGEETGMFVDCLVVGMLDDFEPSEGFTHIPVLVTKKEE